MNPRQRRRLAERHMADVERAKKVLDAFDVANVADLIRRSECAPGVGGDGGGLGDGAGGGGRGAVSRPVEGAVLAMFTEDGELRSLEPDPIGQALSELFASLTEACKHLQRVDHLRQVVIHAGDKLKGRPSAVGICGACERTVTGVGDDRIRAGYCLACYRAWQRFSRRCDTEGLDASHVVFRAERKAQLAEEAEAAVPVA